MSVPVVYSPQGPVNSIVATTSSPTAIQVTGTSSDESPFYVAQNLQATIDVTLGWGATTIEAAVNAAATTSGKQAYVKANQEAVIRAQPDAFFAGITSTITANVKIQQVNVIR